MWDRQEIGRAEHTVFLKIFNASLKVGVFELVPGLNIAEEGELSYLGTLRGDHHV